MSSCSKDLGGCGAGGGVEKRDRGEAYREKERHRERKGRDSERDIKRGQERDRENAIEREGQK